MTPITKTATPPIEAAIIISSIRFEPIGCGVVVVTIPVVVVLVDVVKGCGRTLNRNVRESVFPTRSETLTLIP